MHARIPLVAAALALVAVSVLSPLAVAQNQADRALTITLDTSSGKGLKAILPDNKPRLMPELDQARVSADFVVTVPGPSGCVGGQITVTYDLVKLPPGVIATLSPRVSTQPYSGGEQANDAVPSYAAGAPHAIDGWHTEAVVMFQRTVPAFADQVITIKATAAGGGGGGEGCTAVDSQSTEVGIPIRADYMPNMQYSPDAIIQTSGQNKKVTFPITVTNYGNGATRVVTTVSDAKGLETLQPPGEFLVDSKAMSGQAAQDTVRTSITVLTSTDTGYTNKVHAFTATFRARSDTAGQDLVTQEITIPFSIKVQGVYVPGFDAPIGLAALGIGLVGLASRRRRDLV